MELYKRGNSPFWYFDIPDPKAPGGRRRKSTKRTSKAEAREVARAAHQKVLDRDQLGALEEVTVFEAVSRYVRSVRHKSDYLNIVGRSRKLIGRNPDGAPEPKLGKSKPKPEVKRWHLDPEKPFHELTKRDVNRLREERRLEGNGEQTINNEMIALSATYYLMKEEGVRVSADLSFPKPKVPGKLRWFTYEEADRILAELDPAKDFVARHGHKTGLSAVVRRQRQDAYDLAVTLLDTGARLSEIGTIPWTAMDTAGWRWIDLYRSKTGNSSMLTMTGRLREVMQRREAARGNSAFVFAGYNDDGEDTPRSRCTGAIRRAIDRAGCNSNPAQVKRDGKATCHTFRDTFASWLVQRGVSLFKVQQLLGHTTPMMTQKYAKLAPGAVADEAAEILDQLATERAA